MRDPNESRPDIEERWREWSKTETAINEQQLRRNLLDRMPAPQPQVRPRVVLVAAAASLLAVLISFEAVRQPVLRSNAFEEPAVVYETGDNVILVLRDSGDPIYVLTEAPRSSGDKR